MSENDEQLLEIERLEKLAFDLQAENKTLMKVKRKLAVSFRGTESALDSTTLKLRMCESENIRLDKLAKQQETELAQLRAENERLKDELENSNEWRAKQEAQLATAEVKDPTPMNEQQTNIAIAEACGFEFKHFEDGSLGLKKPNEIRFTEIDSDPSAEPSWYVHLLPNYVRSLDAMHSAEQTLTLEQKRDYMDNLMSENAELGEMLRQITFATAAQRALAFIKTLNLERKNEQ